MACLKTTFGVASRWVGTVLVMALVGCGDTALNPKTPAPITSASAPTIAATVIQMDDLVTGVGIGSGQVVAAGLTPPPAQVSASRSFNLVGFTIARLQKIFAHPPATPAVAAQLISVNNQACDVSGTVSYRWNDQDNNNVLSVNDDITAAFAQCVDVPGETLNGGFSITLHGLIGNPALPLTSWWLSATLNLDHLSMAQGTKTLTLTAGGLSFITSTRDGLLYTGSVSGAALAVDGLPTPVETGNFNYQFTHDANTLAYTSQGNGDLVSTNMGGRVAFLTLVMFQGIGSDFPTTGSMKINGAKNANATANSIIVTATGNGNVTLAVDTNGDGMADDTINTTWGGLGL